MGSITQADVGAAVLLHRNPRLRFRANALGLGLSTLYLVSTAAGKVHVRKVFDRSLAQAGIEARAGFSVHS